MITTTDGITKKRGDKVWEIGITSKGVHKPTMSVVHSYSNPVLNPDKSFSKYELCLEECEKLNHNVHNF